MSQTVKIKNSTNTSAPTSLELGELALGTTAGSEKLYMKNSAGSIVVLNDFSKILNKPSTLSGYNLYNLDIQHNSLFSNLNITDVTALANNSDYQLDYLQFNAPNSVEYSTDNGSTWATTTIPYNMFVGKSHREWSNFSCLPTWTNVRFTWNNMGYIYYNYFSMTDCTNGNKYNAILQCSSDGNTWNEIGRASNIDHWPGYFGLTVKGNTGSNSKFRVLLNLTHNNSNNIDIGSMRLFASYGGGIRLFDWDYNRKITLYGDLTGTKFIKNGGTSSQFLKADGSIDSNSYYHSGNFTNLNQLTTRNFSDLQSKPTTLSGYGITDAATSSHTHSYLPLSGGTISGNLGTTGTLNVTGQATFNDQFYTKKNIMMQSTSASGDNTIFSNDQPINIIKYDANWVNKSSIKLTDSGINATGNLTSTGSITTGDYLYTSGDKGWYNSSRACGLTSDTYGVVRGWNSTKFKIYSTDSDSINTLGGITAAGEITAYSASDKRLKKNIKPLRNSLDVINKLKPVSFNWNKKSKELNPNKDDNKQYGLIAQDVEKVIPSLVHTIYNEYKSVDYQQLISILVSSVQEQQREIDELKQTINEIKNKMK